LPAQNGDSISVGDAGMLGGFEELQAVVQREPS
jgi:hypothetical protein